MTAKAGDTETDVFTLQQVRTILMYGRLEGAPVSVLELVADLKANGKWPA